MFKALEAYTRSCARAAHLSSEDNSSNTWTEGL